MCRDSDKNIPAPLPFFAQAVLAPSFAATTGVASGAFTNRPATHGISVCTLAAIILLCLPSEMAFGQQAATEVKPPRIVVCNPLDVFQPGKTKIFLRGRSLKDASEIQTDYPGMSIRIVSHAAAAVPGRQTADETGDEQLELEITLPETVAAGKANLVVVTPAGSSAPRPLLVGGDTNVVTETAVVTENEPNEGFRTAQPLTVPAIVSGSIHADGNVDVFALQLTAAKTIRIQIQAAEAGSNLDSLLTVYSATGKPIAASDDQPLTRDSLIEQTLGPGSYFVIVQDANDRGGPAHPYRMTITANAQ